MSNSIAVTGNLGRDPEFKLAKSGTSVARMRLADTYNKRQPDGSFEEVSTTWYNVICFNTLAELATDQLRKGQRVHVTGRFEMNVWDDEQGQHHEAPQIVANNIFVALSNEARQAKPEREAEWQPTAEVEQPPDTMTRAEVQREATALAKARQKREYEEIPF